LGATDEGLGATGKGLGATGKGSGATGKGSGATEIRAVAMVNRWGKEGKWLFHCHSGRKSDESVKSADEVPFGLFDVLSPKMDADDFE
jgi:hypothetical protein